MTRSEGGDSASAPAEGESSGDRHRRVLELTLALGFVGFCTCVFGERVSGDAAVYFTFIGNFFEAPFSFFPGEVSFGATSPLQVVIQAPLPWMFGEHWFVASRVTNFGLIALGMIVLARCIGGGPAHLIWVMAGTLGAPALLRTAAECYESPLSYLAVALLISCLVHMRWRTCMLLAPSLYLVRPELLIVGMSAMVWMIVRVRHRWRWLWLGCIGAVPSLIYHAYLWAHTGAWVPSSVRARAWAARENSADWGDRLLESIGAFGLGIESWVFTLGGLGCAVALVQKPRETWRPIVLLAVPLLGIYTIFPPGMHGPRYLLPLVPVFVFVWVRCLADSPWSKLGSRTALVVLAFVCAVDLRAYRTPLHRDSDTLLLRDLAERLHALSTVGDRVLIYEIQAQYHLERACIALDGIVSRKPLMFISGEQSFAAWIAATGAHWIVTSNAFRYRPIFRDTPLFALHEHDRASPIGAEFVLGDAVLTKVATNPALSTARVRRFADGVGTMDLPVYGSDRPAWAGHHLMWNSLYRISTRPAGASAKRLVLGR